MPPPPHVVPALCRTPSSAREVIPTRERVSVASCSVETNSSRGDCSVAPLGTREGENQKTGLPLSPPHESAGFPPAPAFGSANTNSRKLAHVERAKNPALQKYDWIGMIAATAFFLVSSPVSVRPN